MITFDNIRLYSDELSTIDSRSNGEINISSPLFDDLHLSLPIVSSPMKDVTNGKVAAIMYKKGGFGFIHRFQSIEDQVNDFLVSEKLGGCAIGLNDYDRFKTLLENGCRYFCLDVANGASSRVLTEMISYHKNHKDDARFCIGNFCSLKPLKYFAEEGITNLAIRLGVSPGTGCTTFNATGIYRNAVSILINSKYTPEDVDNFKTKYNYTFIADGGISEPRHVSAALALKANSVMIGAAIANTSDSPAIKQDNTTVFSGSASFENQKNYKENPKYIEGKTVLLDYRGESLTNFLNRFEEGLLSSFSYINARNMLDFKNFVRYEIV